MPYDSNYKRNKNLHWYQIQKFYVIFLSIRRINDFSEFNKEMCKIHSVHVYNLYSGTREMQISIKNYAIQLSCKFNNSAWCYPPPFRLLRISTNMRSTRKTIISPFWCLWGLGTRLTIYVVVSLYRTYAMVKFCRCVILVVIVVLDLLSCCVHVLFAPHDVHLYVLSCVIPFITWYMSV